MQRHVVYEQTPLTLAKLAAAPTAFSLALAEIYDAAAADQRLAMSLPFDAAVLATRFGADWMKSAIDLARAVLAPVDGSGDLGAQDKHIGVAGAVAGALAAWVLEGPSLGSALSDTAAEAAYTLWYWTYGRHLFPSLPATPPPRPSRIKRPRARAATPTLPGPPTAPRPPTTWGALARQLLGERRFTPKDVSDIGFGIAAGAIEFINREIAPPPVGQPPPTFDDNLLEAVKRGGQAGRQRGREYRHYPTPYKLAEPASLV